ncbi:hypothetical protein [Nocardioides sp.]|uniref:hypothetical protein n=1 Tax=Nocardioides sp. TaxID=35761 RepID=UPI00271C9939|nr:hypothetical protein [Nocardioides sp.]MDO9455966.1 hypothetical protein [Nocardioides sp.]
MTDRTEDRRMAALVASDRPSGLPPDLDGLRAGGRRRLWRRRAAVAGAAAAVVLAIGVPLALVGGDDGRSDSLPEATQPPTPSSTPTPRPSPTAPGVDPAPTRAESVRVPLSGGTFLTGELEEGEIIGATVDLGTYEGYDKVLYPARQPSGDACLSVGLRVDGRLVRLLCAVVPVADTDDRFVMWGGAREEPGTVASVDGPGYLLVGAVPGDTEVAIAAEGDEPRPVTTVRTDVFPGYTVFVDEAPWDAAWDGLQLAPLTVTTGSDLSLDVRRRSYVS